MTYHDDLLAALKTDLVTAGVLTAADQVYAGRRPQKVRRTDAELWLEDRGFEERGGGMQSLRAWRHGLHFFAPAGRSASGADSAASAGIVSSLQAIADRYDGTAYLMSISGVVGTQARVEAVDQDVEQDQSIEGVIALTSLVGG